MFSTKTALFALASLASVQTMAAPVETNQLVQRDASVFSSAMDMDFCMWQSGMLFVGWSVIMEQFGGKSVSDMYSAVDAALKKNSACQSYSWMKTVKGGVGAHNTTIVMSFNTDDFCTAKTMSGILNGVSGTKNFHCGGTAAAGGDPDASNLIAELPGEGADEEPSEEKKRSLENIIQARSPKSSKTTTAVHSTATSAAQSTATGTGNTAHPQGLAPLTEAATINGLHVASVAEMAKLAHLPAGATRAEVIEKLDELAA